MSQMIEVKTAELIGPALDWAVAKVECGDVSIPASDVVWDKYAGHYCPSTDWSQGGPLLHKHRVSTEAPGVSSGFWTASMPGSALMEICQGSTPLVAGCRRLVREHLGNTVNVPAELVTP